MVTVVGVRGVKNRRGIQSYEALQRKDRCGLILETFTCADCGEEFVSNDGFHALCSKHRKRMERLKHALDEGKYEPEDSLDRWFE